MRGPCFHTLFYARETEKDAHTHIILQLFCILFLKMIFYLLISLYLQTDPFLCIFLPHTHTCKSAIMPTHTQYISNLLFFTPLKYLSIDIQPQNLIENCKDWCFVLTGLDYFNLSVTRFTNSHTTNERIHIRNRKKKKKSNIIEVVVCMINCFI